MTLSRSDSGKRMPLSRLRNLGDLAPKFDVALDLGRSSRDRFYRLSPFKRSPLIIVVALGFLVVFSAPLYFVGDMASGEGDGSLFDATFGLFSLFWMLGWSVGVFAIALVVLLLTLGRETARVRGDELILRLGIPGLGVGMRFPGRLIRNFHYVPEPVRAGDKWRGAHLAFDYGGEPIAFGTAVDETDARRLIRQLQAIFVSHDQPPPDVSVPAPARVAVTDMARTASTAQVEQAQPHSWRSLSTLALIVANLVPVAGVLLLGWRIGDVMMLFWAESAVIGLFNLLKLVRIGGWSVLLVGPFFVGHYGAFMAGHLLFIYGFFGDSFTGGGDVSVAEVLADFMQLAPALLAFVISHGVSYFSNFLGRREYLGRTVNQQMGEPYKRIVIMHVTIIFGGFMTLALGSSLPALLLLVMLKLLADTRAHLREHRRSHNGKENNNVE